MHTFQSGDPVSIRDTSLTGTLLCIMPSGDAQVQLAIGGTLATSLDNLVYSGDDAPQRTPDGRFGEGHAYYPPNPLNDEAKGDAKEIRQDMLNQLAPIFKKVGVYVEAIQKPEAKINALSRLAPYILPALSRIEFTDETPRSLTAEERLAEQLRKQREATQ